MSSHLDLDSIPKIHDYVYVCILHMYITYMYMYMYCFQNLKSEIPLVQGVLADIHWFFSVVREKDHEFNMRSQGVCGGFSECEASHCGCYQSRLWNMNGAKVRAWLWHQQANKGWMLSPNSMLLEPSCAQPGSRVLAFISVLKHFGKCGCLAPLELIRNEG